MIRQRHAGDIDGRKQRPRGNDRSALDVIVEGAEAISITLEQPGCIISRKILPLQQHIRPALGNRADECINELVVFGAAHALVLPADVNGIRQALGIVGTGIEQDRQSGGRVQSAARGIKRELADRDTHPARALIAEAEDTLAIGHDDGLDVVEARIGQDALDLPHMGETEEESAGLAKGVAEFLAANSDRGRVHDWQHFG